MNRERMRAWVEAHRWWSATLTALGVAVTMALLAFVPALPSGRIAVLIGGGVLAVATFLVWAIVVPRLVRHTATGVPDDEPWQRGIEMGMGWTFLVGGLIVAVGTAAMVVLIAAVGLWSFWPAMVGLSIWTIVGINSFRLGRKFLHSDTVHGDN
ncbi:MAG: hypothetical protein ACJ77A_11200 [Actinomycetota bacterium]